jgi:phytoene dehydrogenase-like protein
MTAKLDLPRTDVIVVGSGPNGLAAAIRLAQARRSVLVVEGAPTPGGGVRSAEATLPGFVHDVCSSVYPMAVCSPFLSTLPLREHGLHWVFSPAAMAHPFEDAPAALLFQSLEETADGLGADDGAAYRLLIKGLLRRWPELFASLLGPPRAPRHPFLLASFGLNAIRPASNLARATFKTDRARGFFAGIAAHSMLPLEDLSTSAAPLLLSLAAHAAGWPIVRGGAQNLTVALISYLKSLGGQVITDCPVESLDQLPAGAMVLLDVTPRQLLHMTSSGSPNSGPGWPKYRRRLERYGYGNGAYKIDWALSRPVPWLDPACGKAITVHLGATLEEIERSERLPAEGKVSPRPFVLFAQPSLFDSSRAPAGKHTAWGYCHVPNGYPGDATALIEQQVERFAPGFRESILARSIMTPADLEAHNPNLIGGDLGGGALELTQFFLRPTPSLYKTPSTGVYLCSSSTPPGPGVHGMCGYWAAERALQSSR